MTEPPEVPILDTARLRLRPITEDDAPGLHEAYGNAEAMRFWDGLPSRDLAETVLRIRRSLEVSPHWHATFAVEQRASGRFVGAVNYHERRPLYHRLVLGWLIVPNYWRQDLTLEAVSALLRHCFQALDTHRIEAEIDPANVASRGLAERLGFQREGLMRDRLWVESKPSSCLMYALLRPEWGDAGHPNG
ncbi:MAG: GNAT family N-acetyltransferase [Acetobacteraceae bacterium]|nr:GNAT family N-acetyltransferase [Acetobacteraceae bacterium]